MSEKIENNQGEISSQIESIETVPMWQKIPATLFSYLFHPIFLIGIIGFYLIFINRWVCLGLDENQRRMMLIRICATSVLMPLVTVLLLKGLGFINSIQLKTQKERIIPYVACITFFFWSFYVSKQLSDPLAVKAFLLSNFITVSVALVVNNFMKISMHALAMGGMVALFILLLYNNQISNFWEMVVAFFVAALAITSRLVLNAHTQKEIFAGFILSFIVQMIAWMIMA